METKWILKIVDNITAPMRGIQAAVDSVAAVTSEVTDEANVAAQTMAQVLKPVRAASSAIQDIGQASNIAANDLDSLTRNIDTVKGQLSGYEAKLEVETDPEKIRAYTTMVDELKLRLNELERQPDPAESRSNWASFATAANQAYEIVEKLASAMDFTSHFNDLQNNIQRMSGLTGEQLSSITKQVTHIADVFNEDGQEIARAANALTKQIGGTFEENLALIQAGFEKGANLNGDMIDQLKEYPAQVTQLGLSAAQSLALMAHAGKDGVFSDKAIDAIKEAGTSLREMGQPQIDALHAIGLKVKDVAGKTGWEATQMVAKAMQTASTQAKQMALSDIFKGAGEDAGLGFIEGLGDVNLDINKIPSVQQAGASTKGFLADMKGWFADTFGGIAQHVNTLGSVGAAIAGFLPLLSAIRSTTMGVAIANKLAAAGQWLLNTAMAANPFGIVAAALAAVTAGVVYAWNHFEGFREVVLGVWEVFKTVFNNIAGLFKAVFEPIGKAISAIQDGRYMDAAKAALELSPVGMVVNATKYIAEGGLTKGVGEAWQKGTQAGKASFAAEQAKDKPASAAQSPYTDCLGKDKPAKVTLDGQLFNPKTAKMGSGSALEINGATAGNGKTINMNLNFHQTFNNISSKLDMRKVADEIAGIINERLTDTLVTAG